MDISIIIPTTARKLRGPFLLAAIESVLAQSEHRGLPIVVVNGNNYLPELLVRLQNDKRVRLLCRDEPGEMAAVAAGRLLVDTEYFGILDDDDIYLPNAFEVRLAAFSEEPIVDAVVTNGFRRTQAEESVFCADFRATSNNALLALLRENWITSAGVLFRSAAIGAEIFTAAPAMLEYTYIGLRLALKYRLRFVDVPTFVKQELLPDAISASKEYALLQPSAIRQLMNLPLPLQAQKRLGQKLAAACHHASTLELADGHMNEAWHLHLKSIRSSTYGLRYLSYTRHLLAKGLQNALILGQCLLSFLDFGDIWLQIS